MNTSEQRDISQTAGTCCDLCGYSRTGISAESRCPECGEVPAIISVGSLIEQYRSAGEMYWLRAVGVGLVVFVGAWVVCFVVVLAMPVGTCSLPAVSFVGPKVCTTALLMRMATDEPGNWGVVGTVAVMVELAGVWLLTERQSVRGDHEAHWSLRRMTRWTAVICVGGMLGRMLGYDGTINSEWSDRLNLWISLGVGELPANLVLYLYLRQLARKLDVRRAGRGFDICAWAVPVVIAASVAVVFVQPYEEGMPYRAWRIICGVFGIGTTAVGVVAFGAVGQLMVAVVGAGFGDWVGGFGAGARRGLRE